MQSFPLKTQSIPKLVDGAYCVAGSALHYTADDVRSIVAYAKDRGVRVVPCDAFSIFQYSIFQNRNRHIIEEFDALSASLSLTALPSQGDRHARPLGELARRLPGGHSLQRE